MLGRCLQGVACSYCTCTRLDVTARWIGLDVTLQGGRAAKLEAELRAAKRREEKLAALHFRLREDVKAAGSDPRYVGGPRLNRPSRAFGTILALVASQERVKES